MLRNSRLRWLLGLLAALSLVAAACGDDSDEAADSDDPMTAATPPLPCPPASTSRRSTP